MFFLGVFFIAELPVRPVSREHQDREDQVDGGEPCGAAVLFFFGVILFGQITEQQCGGGRCWTGTTVAGAK